MVPISEQADAGCRFQCAIHLLIASYEHLLKLNPDAIAASTTASSKPRTQH